MRDLYELDDKVVSVTTDRQSGFDRHLASIPFKGQVVNQTSVWWLRKTSGFVENALLSAPHPNVAIMKKCRVFPVEFVVRGYLTGSTGTSIWTNYSKGVRSYCGNDLPDGLVKNDKLEKNIVTPTTKADEGDVPITPSEIVDQGLMTQQEWDEVSTKALALFNYGQEVARKNGLLLVDTKYEFGVDEDGKILLIDEVSSKRKRRRTRTKLALFFFFSADRTPPPRSTPRTPAVTGSRTPTRRGTRREGSRRTSTRSSCGFGSRITATLTTTQSCPRHPSPSWWSSPAGTSRSSRRSRVRPSFPRPRRCTVGTLSLTPWSPSSDLFNDFLNVIDHLMHKRKKRKTKPFPRSLVTCSPPGWLGSRAPPRSRMPWCWFSSTCPPPLACHPEGRTAPRSL